MVIPLYYRKALQKYNKTYDVIACKCNVRGVSAKLSFYFAYHIVFGGNVPF